MILELLSTFLDLYRDESHFSENNRGEINDFVSKNMKRSPLKKGHEKGRNLRLEEKHRVTNCVRQN